MRRPLHLTPKLTLAFVLFAVVLLICVGILAYNSGRTALEAATFSGLLSSAIEKEAAFETWIAEGQTQIASIVVSPFIRETVAALRTASNPAATQTAHVELIAELEALTGEGRTFLDILVLEPGSGKVIAATDANEERTFKEDRPYFINGQSGPYVQNIYFSFQCQCAAMTASAPIWSDNGELLAVLAGRMNLEEMTAIISRTAGLRETTDSYLVNTSSLFVTQPRFISDSAVLQRGVQTTAVRHCLTGSSGSILADDYNGVPAMAVYRWLPNRQVCLVVKVDQAEALEPVQVFGRTLLLTAGIALLVASILAVGLARTITRPILALKAGVIRFGQGDLNTQLLEVSKDEIGSLAHEFNTMANAIAEKETLLQNYSRDLEQRVEERTSQLSFLAEASTVLSESFDYAGRLKHLAELAVPRIADWCAVDILESDGTLKRLAVVHSDPAMVEWAYELQRRYPPDPNAPQGVYNVVRTGQSEFMWDIPEEMLLAAAQNQEQIDMIRKLGLKSVMTIPLMAHGRALGALALVMSESGRHYGPADLALAEDLARRAALLIDNARLYQDSQQLNATLEQRVTERTAALETANKELEAFSYSVSHDLRAPLRAIDGFSRIMLEKYAPQLDPEAVRYSQKVRDNARRMSDLIDDLLTFSRLSRQALNKRQVQPASLVRQAIDDLAAERDGRQIEIAIGDLPACIADPSLLSQVYLNLVGNAIKYTRHRDIAHIEIGCQQSNGERVYFVKDDGAGFDMKYSNKLFGVFQRLHSATEYEGTGVGLALVQRVVHRHNGRVWGEAEVDKGAAFYFTLGEN
jgi:signal transduction histidine kinase